MKNWITLAIAFALTTSAFAQHQHGAGGNSAPPATHQGGQTAPPSAPPSVHQDVPHNDGHGYDGRYDHHDHGYDGYSRWLPWDSYIIIDPYLPYAPYGTYVDPNYPPYLPYVPYPVPQQSVFVGSVIRQLPKNALAGQLVPITLFVTLPQGMTYARLGIVEQLPPGWMIQSLQPISLETGNLVNRAVWRFPNVSGSLRLTIFAFAPTNAVGWQHFVGQWKLEGGSTLPTYGDSMLWLDAGNNQLLPNPLP